MAPRSNNQNDLEKKRQSILQQKQLELSERLTTPVNRRRSDLLPGEQEYKKRFAMIRRLSEPGITLKEISAELGEAENTVKNWFAEPEVKEEYEFLQRNLSETAIESLRNYQLEAIATLVTLMRFGSEKYMFDAAKEILGINGITSISKTEVTKKDTQIHELDNTVIQALRELPEHEKEEAAKGIEQLGKLLERASSEQEGI